MVARRLEPLLLRVEGLLGIGSVATPANAFLVLAREAPLRPRRLPAAQTDAVAATRRLLPPKGPRIRVGAVSHPDPRPRRVGSLRRRVAVAAGRAAVVCPALVAFCSLVRHFWRV